MSSRSPAARVARRLDARGIHYGWVIAAVSFLTLITAAGFRSTVGVLIVPLQDEFGWSRATISAAVAINLVLYGLGGPFAAGLYDRFGIRRVIVIALATIAISSTLTTQIDAPWQLDLLWGVANGLSTGAIGVTLAAVIASRWFVERRGIVTGMLTASNATGQLESEIADESWIIEQALPEDVFTEEHDDLWSAVLRRKGGAFAVLAQMPPDPSSN